FVRSRSTARSRPRAASQRISSGAARTLRRASLTRRATRRFSRSAHSRSTSRPSLSSKESCLSGGMSSISRRLFASVCSLRSMSLLIVSSMVTVFLLVEVAAAAHELMSGGVESNGMGWRRRAFEAPLEDAFDVAAVRRALACNGERAQTRRIHALGPVLLRAAQDAEYRAIAHLRARVALERAADDLDDVRPELAGPREHTLGWPIAVVLVGLRAVLGVGDRRTLTRVASAMRGHAGAAVEAFDDACGCTHLDGLLAKHERNAVVATVELDVVVNVGAGALALSKLEAQRW